MREQHSALNARDDLLAIADIWPDLLDRLGREGSRVADGMPRSKTAPGLVINESVSDAMATITAWTGFLVRVLLDETDRVPPAGLGVPALLTHIARERLGHFTAHPDDGLRLAFHDDAREHRELAQRHAYPSGRRWIPVHIACLDHATSDVGERVPCRGEYRVLLDPDLPGLIPDMVCEADPSHRISPLDWQRAARKSGFDPEQIRERLAVARGSA